jgi:nitrite reductase/ring-hydroxylating ferredoxin subunit
MFSVKWRRLIRESDLIASRVQVRKVQRDLAGVVKVQGRIYVFDGRCPHAGRSLHGCEVTSGGIMECPSHGLRLSLTPPACSAKAIPVTQLAFRLSDGIVEISRGALRRKHPPSGPG